MRTLPNALGNALFVSILAESQGRGFNTPPPETLRLRASGGVYPYYPLYPPLCMPPSELKNTIIFPISLLIGVRSAAVCCVQWAHAYNATKKLRLGLHCDKIQQIKGSKTFRL